MRASRGSSGAATASGPAVSIGARSITWFRLARHRLVDPRGAEAPGRVASAIGGAQAQLLPAAFASLGIRTTAARPPALLKALWRDRSLAVLWTLRGTLHMVPASEVAQYGRGTTGRWEREVTWFRGKGLAPARLAELLDRALDILDAPRTLAEFAAELGRDLGSPPELRKGGGWGSASKVPWLKVAHLDVPASYLIRVVGARGVVCRAAPRDGEPTFVAARRWIPGWRDVDRGRAVDELLTTYLGAFGPASPRDFAVWSGLRGTEVSAAWRRAEDRIASVMTEGDRGSILRRDLDELREARVNGPSVRLLPYFDVYLLGHRRRTHLVAPERHRSVYRPQGWIAPVLLVDGEVAGTWSARCRAGRYRIDVLAFRPLGAPVRRALRSEAMRAAEISGEGPAELHVGRAP